MADNLATYRGKRRFSGEAATREPEGGRASRARKAANEGLRYVVQEHHARNLHYDFRLELDGTLKSWAIPKGPSEDPKVKRLAVHVEDHPVEYGAFEGTIPKGHYGAGDVKIWDHGSWEPEGGIAAARKGYAAGKLTFRLHGERLQGRWALVRTRMHGKQAQWLLLKEREAEASADAASAETAASAPPAKTAKRAKPGKPGNGKPTQADDWRAIWERVKTQGRRAACPETMKPQLATLVDSVPGSGEWSYEIKFDGYRIVAQVRASATKAKRRAGPVSVLYTREGNDWTAKLPEQAAALSAWTEAIGERYGSAIHGAWFDGEAVAFNKEGVPDFQSLQNAFDAHRSSHIVLYLFDLPYFNGYDLREVPLSERRALLRALLAEIPVPDLLRFSEDFAAPPAQLLSHACALSLEGVIGKRTDSAYRAGRAPSWIKLKCRRRQEFVIAGFTEPAGSRSGVGALLLAVYDKTNTGKGKGKPTLQYAGRVGTGFDAAMLKALRAKLDALEKKHGSATAPVSNPPASRAGGKVHWVTPTLVAECAFAEWTRDGVLRQASFIQLRDDKSAKDIVREDAAVQPASAKASKKTAVAKASALEKEASGFKGNDVIAGVRVTHPDRVVDKQSGARKIDLVRYSEWIAPWLLPELKQRPVSLMRVTGDIDGESFFQKHAPKQSIPHVTQHADLDPGHPPLLTLDSVDALVGAAQMGAMELHTWNARVDSIEKPDRMIFDLDPGAGLPWARMIEAARLTHTILEEIGLKAFCKTSGGKGLHIVVPLTRHASWELVRDFAQSVAQHLAKTLPDHFIAKMGEKNRKGKVFVDYLRNNRGASTVAAFSLRARPGLGISVPITWDELASIRGGDHWTLETIPERMAQWPDATDGKKGPWHGYATARQRITAEMRKRLQPSKD
ncbi:DNA ligase D [Robbsia sp. KACC 23696]|uniref:DNA ligase D n=1 Tax=Robbsia sp. KACC 23696 TaxID=3149231 RepID=UPI00325A8E10